MKRICQSCFILASLYAAFAWAGSSSESANARPQFGPLNAGQVAQVQSIGQSLLVTKGNVAPASAEEQALLTELHGLADSVNQAMQFNSGSVNLQLATTGTGDSTTTATPSSTAIDAISQHIARLHEQRAAIDSLPLTGDEARQQVIARVKILSQRAGLLEQAAQDALNAADNSQRFAHLAALKQRLRSRTLAEWWQDHDAMAADITAANGTPAMPSLSTPTMTTLTQHRAGLDDLRSQKP